MLCQGPLQSQNSLQSARLTYRNRALGSAESVLSHLTAFPCRFYYNYNCKLYGTIKVELYITRSKDLVV